MARHANLHDTYHSRPISLKPGRYTIVLKNRHYEPLTLKRNVKAGQKLYLTDLKLQKKVIKVPQLVRVDSLPTKMTLRGKDNNTFISRNIMSHSDRLMLEPGRYALAIEYKGRTIEREVYLKEGSGGFTINLNFSR